MKKIFFISLVLISLNSLANQKLPYRVFFSQCKADTNSLIIDSILNLNLASYIGQPVDSLLHHLPITDSAMKIVAADKSVIARKLWVTYQTWYKVIIIVDTFQYMNPVDTTVPPNWNITLFKKETIAWIFVDRGYGCVYGCNTNSYRE